jgi:hypothetical protein
MRRPVPLKPPAVRGLSVVVAVASAARLDIRRRPVAVGEKMSVDGSMSVDGVDGWIDVGRWRR